MLKKILDTLLSVAVLAAVVAVGITVQKMNRIMSGQPEVKNYVEGQTVDFLPVDHKVRLVLGISPTCSWCKKDVPLYQRIGKSRRVIDGSVTVVDMVPPELKDASLTWLKESEIPGAIELPAKGKKYPFSATPTLILAQGNKIVWTHKGGATVEAERTLFAKLDN